MKPPLVHQPVEPPRSADGIQRAVNPDGVVPAGEQVAADDGRDMRQESTEQQELGLVGNLGAIVGAPMDDRDGAADDEKETR